MNLFYHLTRKIKLKIFFQNIFNKKLFFTNYNCFIYESLKEVLSKGTIKGALNKPFLLIKSEFRQNKLIYNSFVLFILGLWGPAELLLWMGTMMR